MLNRFADFVDPFSLHENLPWLQHIAGVDLEQARGVQNDGRGRGRLLGGCDACPRDCAKTRDAEMEKDFSHGYEYNKRRRSRRESRWQWAGIRLEA
jgi:hypothetical protein